MSIIGPRPLLVCYLPRYNEEQHHRHRAYSKPIGNAFIHSAGKRINFNQYELIVVENGVSFGSYMEYDCFVVGSDQIWNTCMLWLHQ